MSAFFWVDFYFHGCDSGNLFINKPESHFFPCSLAWRGAVSMETGCDRDASVRLGPAGRGARGRVHWLWEGERDGRGSWSSRGGRERDGETWVQLQGGVAACLLMWMSVKSLYCREKHHRMKNYECVCVCVWTQVPRDVAESEMMMEFSGKPWVKTHDAALRRRRRRRGQLVCV